MAFLCKKAQFIDFTAGIFPLRVELMVYVNSACCKKKKKRRRGILKDWTHSRGSRFPTHGHSSRPHTPPPVRNVSVAPAATGVYRQTRRHFNLSPRYLICRGGTLEGPQTKEHTAFIEQGQGSHNIDADMAEEWHTGKKLAGEGGAWWRQALEGGRGAVKEMLWRGIEAYL